MHDLFISYRRDDTRTATELLRQKLRVYYCDNAVYYDVHSNHGGTPYPQTIRNAIQGCAVMLVMIGPVWLDELRARLSVPDDWVRLEIEQALQEGKTLIPILVDGAVMPSANEVPSSLAPLTYLQARTLRPGSDFDHDFDAIMRDLHTHHLRNSCRGSLGIIAATMVSVAATLAAFRTIGDNSALLIGGSMLSEIGAVLGMITRSIRVQIWRWAVIVGIALGVPLFYICYEVYELWYNQPINLYGSPPDYSKIALLALPAMIATLLFGILAPRKRAFHPKDTEAYPGNMG